MKLRSMRLYRAGCIIFPSRSRHSIKHLMCAHAIDNLAILVVEYSPSSDVEGQSDCLCNGRTR